MKSNLLPGLFVFASALAAACSSDGPVTIIDIRGDAAMADGSTPIPGDGSIPEDAGTAGETGPGDGSVGVDGGGSCIRSKVVNTQRPLDLAILVDNSGSIDQPGSGGQPGRIEIRRAYVQGLSSAPLLSGATAMVHSFPRPGGGAADSCDPAAYQPVLLTSVLPSTTIGPFVNTLRPAGGSVLAPALQGAYQALAAAQLITGPRPSALLLVTDGMPNSCEPNNTWQGIAAAAQTAFAKGTKTYFVSLTNDAMDLPGLNAAARAGGTGTPHIVDAVTKVQADLATVVDALRGEMMGVPCSQALPSELVGAGDAAAVAALSVFITEGGVRRMVPFDASCTGSGGFTLRSGKVELCPASCLLLSKDLTSSFEIGTGCPSSP
jgi:hypothetical protein